MVSSVESNPPTYFKQLNTVPGDANLKVALLLAAALAIVAYKEAFLELGLFLKTAVLLGLGLTDFFIYIVITVVYRLWFHPLAKYPGPFLGRFTDWYSVYHSINTNTGLRDIYQVRANCQKSQYFSVFSHFFKVPMSMTTIDRKAHAFKRRIDAEALTSSAIQDLEEPVLCNVRKFCGYMIDAPEKAKGGDDEGWSTARNMSEWPGYLMTDTMGDITFHRNWNMMDSSENRELLKTLSKEVAGLNMFGHMLGILEMKLDKILFRGAAEGTYKYQELSEDSHDGGWSMRLRSKSPIFSEPSSQRGIRKRAEASPKKNWSRRPGCSSSPGEFYPVRSFRVAWSSTGRISRRGPISAWPTMPSTTIRRPERWLLRDQDGEGVDAAELALQQSAYAPFSVGRASCVGKTLAYQEIIIVLARLLWSYEMRLEPGASVGEGSVGQGRGRELKREFQTYDNFVAAHDGPMVQFRPRVK
ncbi:hypothetical protein G7Y89_g12020 [Cudoniella acicularis]|uniref:Cytochrome P450 n=1 Tax=Cudoniella acicularis TaxID=354080 RepID=A0A8H4VXF6_9HELO|nr:hypothetical protein G7Y89_g12020 [Cudoniella acicularis]